jgi:hypothetical protein
VNSELQEKLKLDHPILLDAVIECEDGWYKLIDKFCRKMERKYKSAVSINNIEQRTGTLRFVFTFHAVGNNLLKHTKILKLILDTELKSEKTCEVCGKRAKLRLSDDKFVFVLCDKHLDWMKHEDLVEIEEHEL